MELQPSFDSTRIFDSCILRHGDGIVMLSAPHAAEQTRGGKIKFAEPDTSMIASNLSEALHLPCIVRTSNVGDDPNADRDCEYKRVLAEYIASRQDLILLLDLHQMASWREQDVILGTGKGNNVNKDFTFVARLYDMIVRSGFVYSMIDEKFCASNENTISAFTNAQLYVPSIQIEMNTRHTSDIETRSKIESILRRFIEEVVKDAE